MSCGLIYLIGRIYANRILHPLKHMLKELKRIRGNNLNIRMKTFGNKDELDDLIRTLNGCWTESTPLSKRKNLSSAMLRTN